MHNGAVGDFQGVKKMVVNRLSDEYDTYHNPLPCPVLIRFQSLR